MESGVMMFILQAAVSGAAAWAAIKVELRYIARDAEQAHKHAERAHERINELLSEGKR